MSTSPQARNPKNTESTESPAQPDAYDSPWKDVLELYLEEFFEFFLPEAHGDIDWQRPPVSLDKELRKITRDGEVGERFADKLFQVWDVGGEPLGLMANVEVQGSPEAGFAERLFVYNYRAFDRFHRPVITVAVLCDATDSFHPRSFYAADRWGCRVGIEFLTVKLRQYNKRWDELEASHNPFALVTMAHLKTQETRGRPDRRYRWKLRLVRRLYDQGYAKKDVLELFRFVDWLMALPQELEQQLDADIESLETERGMKYVTGIERRALQTGIKQGIQTGIEQGIQTGIEQGIQTGIEQGIRTGIEQGQLQLLRRLLSRSFGEIPSALDARLSTASRDQIERWADRVVGATSLDDVFGSE